MTETCFCFVLTLLGFRTPVARRAGLFGVEGGIVMVPVLYGLTGTGLIAVNEALAAHSGAEMLSEAIL